MQPQTYKFQITGYEKSHPNTFMLGLGTIDDQTRFTGTLKHENYHRDLSEPAEYDAKSDPYCAWYYAYNYYGDYYYYGYYSTLLVTSLPITNITLVQHQGQEVDTQPLDPRQCIDPAITELENKQITADLLEALEAMCTHYGYKSYMTRELDPEISGEAVLIKARTAITKAKGQ